VRTFLEVLKRKDWARWSSRQCQRREQIMHSTHCQSMSHVRAVGSIICAALIFIRVSQSGGTTTRRFHLLFFLLPLAGMAGRCVLIAEQGEASRIRHLVPTAPVVSSLPCCFPVPCLYMLLLRAMPMHLSPVTNTTCVSVLCYCLTFFVRIKVSTGAERA
jgi:hypothetical protein